MGVFSCVAIVFAHLALTDIYHAEYDTSLEWTILQICFAVLIAFVISVFSILFVHRTRTKRA